MKPRTSARLAWLVFLGSAALTLASLVLWLARVPEPLEVDAFLLAAAFVAFPAVGAVILSRQPGHLIGRLFLLIGLAAALANMADTYARIDPQPIGYEWAALLATWAFQLGFGIVPLTLLLFPDGRPPSRRWRWVAPLIVAALIVIVVGITFSRGLDDYPGIPNPLGLDAFEGTPLEGGGLGFPLLVLGSLAAAVAQIVRFRRSRGAERQQMKWLAYAAALLGVGWVTLPVWFGAGGIAGGVVFVSFSIALFFLPVAVGIAILRHRLYDIDVVINKTLVYGLLTAVLIGVYVGAVIGLGAVARSITDVANNSVVVAVSTLAVAALFRPVRRRIQGFIDRRFYRRKYDAARTLDAFAARLREEVDLEALRADLVGVVQETMQPAHVSLWFSPALGAPGRG